MLVLTEDGIIAARDYTGRTTLVIGRRDDSYAVTSETTAFPNLDYEIVRDVAPGEIIRLRADSMEVLQGESGCSQICSFLWVYYGFPASDYEGINTEYVRERCGKMLGLMDESHNASGEESNVGEFFREAVQKSCGVCFASAKIGRAHV